MRTIMLLVLASALGVGGYYGYQHFRPTEDAPKYRTDTVTEGEITATAMATGTVEPLVKVLVGSQVSGTVVQWFTDFNDEVKQGQILAELDQDRIRADVEQNQAAVGVARARLLEVRAGVERAALELDRLERAHAVSGASDFELARARVALQAAEAGVQALGAQVEMAEAQLRAAQIQFDKTIIRSPIDGVVISRNIDAGQTVAASLSAPILFTIANDLRQMRVNAAVSETDIGRIREGMAVEFRVDAYPKTRFKGVVTQVRFAETVVDNVVTYETLIGVKNDELLLRPGMTATILFEVERVENALLVPNAALRYDPNREQVVVNWRPGKAQPKKPRVYKLESGELIEVNVQLGVSDGKFTAVVSDQLSANDVVVVGEEFDAKRAGGARRGPF